MRLKETGKILTAQSKPYNINGNEGVSHKVRVLFDTDIFPLKATPELVEQCSDLTGEEVELIIDLTSIRENIGVSLVSVVE